LETGRHRNFVGTTKVPLRQFAFCQEKPNKSKVSAILEEK